MMNDDMRSTDLEGEGRGSEDGSHGHNGMGHDHAVDMGHGHGHGHGDIPPVGFREKAGFKPSTFLFCLSILCVLIVIVVCIALVGGLARILKTGQLPVIPTVHVPLAAVSCSSKQCAQVGKEIMMQGGAAVDAAVAVALCMAVVSPHSASIGGGGHILVYNKNPVMMGGDPLRTSAIDFREQSGATVPPLPTPAAEVDTFLKNSDSIGVPGMISGLYAAHKKWGRMAWADVVRPAATLARNGFTVETPLANQIEHLRLQSLGIAPSTSSGSAHSKNFETQASSPPSSSSAAYSEEEKAYAAVRYEFAKTYLNNNTKAGSTVSKAKLAETLDRIAYAESAQLEFYNNTNGTVGFDVLADLADFNNTLTAADFLNYTARQVQPVCTWARGYKVCSAGGSSMGGSILGFLLNCMAGVNLDGVNQAWDPDSLHVFIESVKWASIVRPLLGDLTNNTQAQIAQELLTSKDLAAQARYMIPYNVLPPEQYKKIYDVFTAAQGIPSNPPLNYSAAIASNGGAAEHISIVDKDDQAVSLSISITDDFGSTQVGARTGIIFNSALNDFILQANVNAPNVIGPNKRPLGYHAPTIVTKDTLLRSVIGVGGSYDGVSSVAEFLLFSTELGFNMTLAQAMMVPRVHAEQWFTNTNLTAAQPLVTYENALHGPLASHLKNRGHILEETSTLSDVAAIETFPDGSLSAGSELNHDGIAGY